MSNYGRTIFHSENGGVIIHEPRTETDFFEDVDDTATAVKRYSPDYFLLFLILYLLNPPKQAATQLEKLQSDTAKTENT